MIVGVPKEIKNNEYRVGMTPSGVNSFINNGHKVFVQKNAGLGSGYSNSDYKEVGAVICDTIELSGILVGPGTKSEILPGMILLLSFLVVTRRFRLI